MSGFSYRRDQAAVYTGETLLRTTPRTYRKVVALLADPDWSAIRIAQACKVSENTIAAVKLREAETIEARKKTLTSVLVDVATLGAEQMERKIGRSSLRDATIATGVSVDKVLALQGQSPVGVQVAVVNMPSEEERRARVYRRQAGRNRAQAQGVEQPECVALRPGVFLF